MKNLKMVGCALVAALLTAASLGAASASAAVLCNAAPNKAGECLGATYAANTEFQATSVNAKITVVGGAVGSVSCTDSTLKLKNTALAGLPGVPIEVTDLTFTECMTNTATACTVTTTKGYTGELTPTNNAGSGSITLKGNAELEVTCGALNCKYKVPAAGITGNFSGGNPAAFVFVAQKLEVAGFGWRKAGWTLTTRSSLRSPRYG